MSKTKKKQKIGMLGGTFDPVHKGHIAMAETVLDRYGLDRILFVPAYAPPHKERTLTSFTHRVAMLEAALLNDARMSVSLLEAERSTPSYTVETLAELHRRIPSADFYLIMGADMFVEIELWYRYRDLFDQADFIVVSRPGFEAEKVAAAVSALPGSFRFDPEEKAWSRDDGFRIFYYPDLAEPISSSDIRARLARGDSVTPYLVEPVQAYIQQHGLYPPSI